MTERAGWLKSERRRLRITQEKLAALASVNVRTVQRAEQGKRVSDEVWMDFEAALGSTPTLAKRSEQKVDRYCPFRNLRRARSARDFLELLGQAAVAKLDCDVEPTPDVLAVLRKAVGFLEERLPRPWSTSQRRYLPDSLLKRIDDEAALNELLDELHGIGAGLYAELQWGHVYYPDEDFAGDIVEPHEPTGRYLLQAVVSASDKDRESFPEVQDWGVRVAEDPFDEEVPF